MTIEIQHKRTRTVLYSSTASTMREALEQAVQSGADLSDADLYGTDLRNADLYGANLLGANLYSADLSDANLRSANLRGANLRGANLLGADLSGANLLGADLSGANLLGANLCAVDLGGANLRSANLRSANLLGADLSDADLEDKATKKEGCAMVKVQVGWSDGQYYWRKAEAGEPFDAEVPLQVVEMWEAVSALTAVVDQQLHDIDNLKWDRG